MPDFVPASPSRCSVSVDNNVLESLAHMEITAQGRNDRFYVFLLTSSGPATLLRYPLRQDFEDQESYGEQVS